MGSASLITDENGNEYQRLEYTPYGEVWVDKYSQIQESTALLPYKFTGKERDEETGLYYYGARYLDAKYSRWISTDPALGEYIPQAPISDEAKKHNQNLPGMGGVFNTVNFNLYHYAGNNPIKYVDPDGKKILILGYNDEDRQTVVNMINEYSYSKYKLDEDGRTLIKDGNKTNGFFGINKSKYYSEQLDEAINSKNQITVLLSDTHLRPDGSSVPNISEEHGGGMTSVVNNDNSKISVTVSPLGNDELPLVNKNGSITIAKESPAEILVHELVGHAIPRATDLHGNAVEKENIVRAQCKLKLRCSEENHSCF